MLFLVIIVNQYHMFIWGKNWNIYSHKTKIHHCLHQADLCKVKKFSELVTNLIQFFTYSHISSNSKFWSTFHWRISLRIAKIATVHFSRINKHFTGMEWKQPPFAYHDFDFIVIFIFFICCLLKFVSHFSLFLFSF